MPKILVLYYSRSGNTEKMAEAVVEGARSVGNVEVELSYHVDAEDLSRFDAVLAGTPTYNHKIPMDMEKLFEEAAANGIDLKGKVGAAFGSYGWSGEAPNRPCCPSMNLTRRYLVCAEIWGSEFPKPLCAKLNMS
jgi:flavodoxin I